MDITAIKAIVDSKHMSHQEMNAEIFKVLVCDETLIPNMLTILELERKNKKELFGDMNMQLSRAHIYIEQTGETRAEEQRHFNKAFIMEQISEFYEKYKGYVKHCFNR
jgi:hypothetical protein